MSQKNKQNKHKKQTNTKVTRHGLMKQIVEKIGNNSFTAFQMPIISSYTQKQYV